MASRGWLLLSLAALQAANAALTVIGNTTWDLSSPAFKIDKPDQPALHGGFATELAAYGLPTTNYTAAWDVGVWAPYRMLFVNAEPEYQAIRAYTDSPTRTYSQLNTELRRGAVQNWGNMTLVLASGIHRLPPLSRSAVLYRGLSSAGPAFLKFEVNNVLVEAGFMSTTTDLSISYSYLGMSSILLVMGEIDCAYDISEISVFPEEEEHLIGPGFEFRVMLKELWDSPTKGKVSVVYALKYPFADPGHTHESVEKLREEFRRNRQGLGFTLVMNRAEMLAAGRMQSKRMWTERNRYNAEHLAAKARRVRRSDASLADLLDRAIGDTIQDDRRRAALPPGWICPAQFYDANDGCDCSCGAYDPDCDLQDGQYLVYGCVGPAPLCLPFGNCSTTPSAVPETWSCPLTSYHAWDGCDCNCGAYDPDCSLPQPLVFGCGLSQVCTAAGTCENGPNPVPAEWICAQSFYNTSDGCDCNCGAPDPDCVSNNTYIFNCPCNVPQMTCEQGFCIGACGNYTAQFANNDLLVAVVFAFFFGGTSLLLAILLSWKMLSPTDDAYSKLT